MKPSMFKSGTSLVVFAMILGSVLSSCAPRYGCYYGAADISSRERDEVTVPQHPLGSTVSLTADCASE
jgi:hypothetical protein